MMFQVLQFNQTGMYVPLINQQSRKPTRMQVDASSSRAREQDSSSANRAVAQLTPPFELLKISTLSTISPESRSISQVS